MCNNNPSLLQRMERSIKTDFTNWWIHCSVDGGKKKSKISSTC